LRDELVARGAERARLGLAAALRTASARLAKITVKNKPECDLQHVTARIFVVKSWKKVRIAPIRVMNMTGFLICCRGSSF